MINYDKVNIVNNRKLFYKNDKNMYKLSLIIKHCVIDGSIQLIETIEVEIKYMTSLQIRKFNSINNRIPKKHLKILSELIEYYETLIVFPSLLQNTNEYKYVNWFDIVTE